MRNDATTVECKEATAIVFGDILAKGAAGNGIAAPFDIEAATIFTGHIPLDSVVGQRQRAIAIKNRPTGCGCAVAAESALARGQQAIVVNAAAMILAGGVEGNAAGGNGQCPLVLNAAAVACRGVVFNVALVDGDLGALVVNAATI